MGLTLSGSSYDRRSVRASLGGGDDTLKHISFYDDMGQKKKAGQNTTYFSCASSYKYFCTVWSSTVANRACMSTNTPVNHRVGRQGKLPPNSSTFPPNIPELLPQDGSTKYRDP